MSRRNTSLYHQIRMKLHQEKDNKIRLQKYTEYLLAGYCMPTLLRMKPASLFHADMRYLSSSDQLMRSVEGEVQYYDCEAISLYSDDKMMIILVYQKELLMEVLSKTVNRSFLIAMGYFADYLGLEHIFSLLRQRYGAYITQGNKKHGKVWETTPLPMKKASSNAEFPHEIGLILGYPVEDVMQFIEKKGKDYLLCGYWKVYQDPNTAGIIFERYTQARNKAMQWIVRGNRLRDYLNNGGY